jgi:hypothetical protein
MSSAPVAPPRARGVDAAHELERLAQRGLLSDPSRSAADLRDAQARRRPIHTAIPETLGAMRNFFAIVAARRTRRDSGVAELPARGPREPNAPQSSLGARV